MGVTVTFWILAAVIIAAALGVIMIKNVFRAALALIVCLTAVAGIFVLLSADFLAGAQILIYVGAISVIIILAIMLTRQVSIGNPSNRLRVPALIVASLLFGLMAISMLNTRWQVVADAPQPATTAVLAERLFGQNGFILPLEISAVLILTVVLGAIVIARGK